MYSDSYGDETIVVKMHSGTVSMAKWIAVR